MPPRDPKGHFIAGGSQEEPQPLAPPADATPATPEPVDLTDADILLPGQIPTIAAPASALDPTSTLPADPTRMQAPRVAPPTTPATPVPLAADTLRLPRTPRLAAPVSPVGTAAADVILRAPGFRGPSLADAIAAAPGGADVVTVDPTRMQAPRVAAPVSAATPIVTPGANPP